MKCEREFDIKRAFTTAIERSGNPLAPIILQEAHARVEALGKLMSGMGSLSNVTEFNDHLLSSFPKEMDDIARDPNFICAVCGILSQALVYYGSELGS